MPLCSSGTQCPLYSAASQCGDTLCSIESLLLWLPENGLNCSWSTLPRAQAIGVVY